MAAAATATGPLPEQRYSHRPASLALQPLRPPPAVPCWRGMATWHGLDLVQEGAAGGGGQGGVLAPTRSSSHVVSTRQLHRQQQGGRIRQ